LLLPSQSLVDERFPSSLARRPKYVVPKEIISSHGQESFTQAELKLILSRREMPKSVKEFILGELKPLFMRTRHLDNSKRNKIIKDFLTILFPQFAEENHEKLIALATDFRKSWNNWRNVLWKKLSSRYKKYIIHQENADRAENPISYLKCSYVIEIFDTWLKFVSSNLSKENEEALRNLIIFGFHCIRKHSENARVRFFSSTGNLYTINCNFPSEYNVATSMDLSLYEIILGDNHGDNSDSDDDNHKKRKIK
jgi:hypothetical protein